MATTATKTAARATKAPAGTNAIAKKAGRPAKAAKSETSVTAVSVKAFARTILYVKDWKPALRFYADALGLQLASPAEEGWAEFATGTTALCIHGGRAAGVTSEAVCSVSFSVDDFDAACAALKSKGVTVGEPHSPCAGLRIAGFRDPSGNDLYIEGK
jgi:predicted enzyme related to lactoylglutathione lyase